MRPISWQTILKATPLTHLSLAGGNWSGARGDLQNAIRDETFATPFGSPNQYLQYDDNSTGNTVQITSQTYTAASNALTTLSFDFLEPDVADRNQQMKTGYAIDSGGLVSAATRQAVSFNNGVLGDLTGDSPTSTTYSMDTAYRFYMIFNDTASSVSYAGGSILGGDAHVWLKNLSTGVNTFAGISSSDNVGIVEETSYNVGFRAGSSGDRQAINIDNFSLDTGAAAIPEPGTYALIFGALARGFAASRRRQS
jgi:hypothetical protein